MDDNEKKAKKIIKEWSNIKRVNELKSAELNILNKIISNGNDTITRAKGEIERIEKEISEKFESHKKIGEIFATFSNDEQTLIHLRYLSGYSWLAVSRKMYLSERQVFIIHKNVLKKINELASFFPNV